MSNIYSITEKGSEKEYPNWGSGKPNLFTYLTALNKSQPIIQCQYELVWSRWPRTIFFAKNISIPGASVNTIEINHSGFTISIPTHVTYSNTEISMSIIADKEGFHYYDLRNMVMQTGHPLVAGDPRATIGNKFNLGDEDTLEIRLRNRPDDETHHHWIIHNFHPTEIGDIELTMDGASFVTFELKGTFTHIHYDCGKDELTGFRDEVIKAFETEEGPPNKFGPLDMDGNLIPMETPQENEGLPEEEEPEDEYMDFREEEPPEPGPEPKPPSYTSLASSTNSLEYNENKGESFVSSAIDASFLEPVDDEYVEGAKECVDELE